MALEERLRWARNLADISAQRLSELADLGHDHVNAIESGRRPNIELKTAKKIARVLGVSLDWLLDGEGDEPTADAIRAAVAAAAAAFDQKHCA